MNSSSKRYRTQWAAQFYTAAELTRRGYFVSLTLGNAPMTDLVAVSTNGAKFMVDVKGLSSKNFWLVREREPQNDLYYVLVHLPSDFQPPEFFILKSAQLMDAIKELKKQTHAAGKKWVDSGAGINWGTALPYKNRWDIGLEPTHFTRGTRITPGLFVVPVRVVRLAWPARGPTRCRYD